jgi:hypothetical protein
MQGYFNVTIVSVEHVSTVGCALKGQVCRTKFMFLMFIVELMPQSKRKKTAASDSRNFVHSYLFIYLFLSFRQHI